jgi:type IV pilus assembly protein PilA
MTKQLNKKGTSLVELIAVIVIMGIIAGIAVPVTIAVINRQKKNAAAKSAEAVVATIKQNVQELVAKASTSIEISLAYPAAAASATNVPTTVSVKVDGTAQTGYEASEFIVENLKAFGTITATYTVSTATYSFDTTTTQFGVGSYKIDVEADGSAKVTGNA